MAEYGDYIRNKHLFATVLALAGWSPKTIERMVQRSPSDLVTQWGQGEALQQGMNDQERETIPAVLQYLQTLGSESLKGLLQAGGMYYETAQRVVDSVQNETRGTPTLQAILESADKITGQPMSSNLRTTLEGIGVKVDPVLNTTRTQWKGVDEPEKTTATTTTASRPSGRETTGVENLLHPLLTPQKRTEDLLTGPEAIPSVDFSTLKTPERGKVTKATEEDGLGAGAGLDLGAGTGVATPPALRSDASPEEVDAHIRKHYGYLSWALDIPDIRQVAKDVAQNPSGWTEATVMGAITATPWWQDNGIKAAEWLQRRAQDSATTQDEIKEQFDSFRSSTREVGIDIPDDRLWDIAEESLKWGWSEGTIQAVLGSEYRHDPSKPTATTRSLKAKAADYLVPIGEESLGVWAKQIITGEKSEEEFTQYVTGMAKSMFPFMADSLDRGDTVAQYVSSYAETAARTLEISPEEVDFTQPKWMRLLTKTDPKTGERGPMAIHEMDRIIRTDSQYGYEYTNQAKDEAGFLASTIMKKMGVTA